MTRIAIVLAAFVCLASGRSAVVRAEELPEDAVRLVAAFEEDAEAQRQEVEAKIAKQRKELASKLKDLQDKYCKAAKLDEAVAIRDKIRQWSEGSVNAAADPGNLTSFAGQVGAKLHFKVTGTTNGYGYGTDVYTADSTLASMAVHAGVLKAGETGVVRVTILPGRNNYLSSTRNGITTSDWSSYPTSYSVERPKGADAAAPKDGDHDNPFQPVRTLTDEAREAIPVKPALPIEPPTKPIEVPDDSATKIPRKSK